jgi:hypothetical protein
MENEETNNEFEDGLNGFLGADIEVEDQAFGSQYPVIQWVNGTPQGKASGADSIAHTGGWFMSADQGIEPPPGFEAYTLVTSEGTEVVGFAKRDLTFSPIRTRRCWTVDPGDGGLLQRFAQADYESAQAIGKPRGNAHIIAGLEGVDEPVLLSLRGMTAKAMMGQGRDRGIIPEYGNKIIRAAKRVARKHKRKGADGKGKSFPLCTFRLTVGPARDDKDKPDFTKVGTGNNTSQITLPVWVDEPKALVNQALLNRLYVGNETFAMYQDIHRETDEWRAAWDAQNLSRTPAGQAGVPATADGDKPLPGDQEIPF